MLTFPGFLIDCSAPGSLLSVPGLFYEDPDTHRHNASLRFLNSLEDQDSTVFDGADGGAIDVPECTTLSNLPTLLELRFTDVPMQRDIFILGINHAERGQRKGKNVPLEFLHTGKTS